VGWIVVADGPGYGESFTLKAGMSAIGRGEDQAVALDFGDTAISRSNHAAIVFDPETAQFFLGHGGKSNIVRLNGQPVISNESLKSGDMIRLGETTLRFVALCGSEFSWSANGGQEAEHVEIA
jgi:pSer/pThr/pTyr-binding forkhead associated (FHA) protein